MFKAVLEKLHNPYLLFAILFLIALGVSIQNYAGVPEIGGVPQPHMTNYGNYQIFSNSFHHLVQHEDIYKTFPEEYTDLYKYSPTFSVLMAPMAVLPDLAGLFLWNFLNLFVLFAALWKFPFTNKKMKLLAFIFILPEAFTSLTNSQSNCLIAGLIIFSFLFLEKNNPAMAALMIALTVYVKLFGLLAFILFLFYPNKLKAVICSAAWFIALFLLPLAVIAPSELLQQYKSWSVSLSNDYSISYGFSIMAWLSTWFGLNLPKAIVVMAGLIVLCIPLLRFRQYNNLHYRILFLSSLLTWIVIFNHKAESPSFVIAVSGIGAWYFSQKDNWINTFLMLLAIVFTLLSTSELFPLAVRDKLLYPYVFKVFPCILIWFKIVWDLMKINSESFVSPETNIV